MFNLGPHLLEPYLYSMIYFKFVEHKNMSSQILLLKCIPRPVRICNHRDIFAGLFYSLNVDNKATYKIVCSSVCQNNDDLVLDLGFSMYFKSPIYSSILYIPTLIFKYLCLWNFSCYRTSDFCNWGTYLYRPVYLLPTELTGSRCTHAHHRITELSSVICDHINSNIIAFTSYLRFTAIF